MLKGSLVEAVVVKKPGALVYLMFVTFGLGGQTYLHQANEATEEKETGDHRFGLPQADAAVAILL
jgi:hypothetical protein